MAGYWGRPRETVGRSLIKAVVYRGVSMSSTIGIAGFIFGDWSVAAGFGLLDAAANTVLYFTHERAWAHVDLRTPEERVRDRRRMLVQAIRRDKAEVLAAIREENAHDGSPSTPAELHPDEREEDEEWPPR